MEIDLPEDEFLLSSISYSVLPASQESASYLQRILKSKEYDPDNIFNQFFLCFVHISQNLNHSLPDLILNLLQNLYKILAPPIISKKLIVAVEAAALKYKTLVNLSELSRFLKDHWKKIEPEALDVFCKCLSIKFEREE